MHVPQFCVILRGPAGAGKSALAAAIQERMARLGRKVAVIDTDIFNWQIVPGEDDKETVYANVIGLGCSYLERGYDVIVEGLILSSEERGAMVQLRDAARSHDATFLEFYCHVPKHVAMRRSQGRRKQVASDLIERWWELAEADKASLPSQPIELDMTAPVGSNTERIVQCLHDTAGANREESL